MRKCFELVLLFTFLGSLELTAKTVCLSNNLTFEIPDSAQELPIKVKGVLYNAEFGGANLILCSVKGKNLNTDWIKDSLDVAFYRISSFKLIDTEKECFWNMTKDYVKRDYADENGNRFASYIWYGSKVAWCLGFFYHSDNEHDLFDKIVNTIHFAEEDGFSQLLLVKKYSWYAWIFAILLMVLASIFHFCEPEYSFIEKSLYCILPTIFFGIILLIPLWGFWTAYFTCLICLYLVSLVCATMNIHLLPDFDPA